MTLFQLVLPILALCPNLKRSCHKDLCAEESPMRVPDAQEIGTHANMNILSDSYTIKAVGQEEFSDVKVPDAPAEKK